MSLSQFSLMVPLFQIASCNENQGLSTSWLNVDREPLCLFQMPLLHEGVFLQVLLRHTFSSLEPEIPYTLEI